MTSDTARFRIPPSWFWSVAYFIVLAAMIADHNLHLLPDPWHWLLKVLVLLLVVPLVTSSLRQARAEVPVSPALTELNMGMLAAVGFCVAVFGIGAKLYHSAPLGTASLWTLGLATSVPVLVMIWLMGRYLATETDEYLRHLAIMSALLGLAAVLVLAIVWGFLESLNLVPHIPSWYVVPLFAVASGIGRAWLKARVR